MKLLKIYIVACVMFFINEHATGQAYRSVNKHSALVSVRDVCNLLKLDKVDNDSVKAFKIYEWIVSNIRYDYKGFYRANNGEVYDTSLTEPSKVIQRRIGVCWGISKLFQAMCDYSGVKSVLVFGKIRGFYIGREVYDGRQSHAWNIIQVGKNKYPVDCTFGISNLKSKNSSFYRKFSFCTPTKYFILQHYADSSKYNLGFEDLSIEHFLRFPTVTLDYFRYFVFSIHDIRKFISNKEGYCLFLQPVKNVRVYFQIIDNCDLIPMTKDTGYDIMEHEYVEGKIEFKIKSKTCYRFNISADIKKSREDKMEFETGDYIQDVLRIYSDDHIEEIIGRLK